MQLEGIDSSLDGLEPGKAEALLSDNRLIEDLVKSAISITNSVRACMLLYNAANERLDCQYGQICSHFAGAKNTKCTININDAVPHVRQYFKNENGAKREFQGYFFNGKEFPTRDRHSQTMPGSQMIVPLNNASGRPIGLLVFESDRKGYFHDRDLGIAKSVASLCSLALLKSQMNGKLKLLSAASNVLLAEFQNKSLTEKLDYVVEKATEILDTELCSLWLVKDGHISLETSYSQKILTTKLLISIKNADLVKKLRYYERIVESTPDPVVICSKDGLIIRMNPGAKNLFGDLLGYQVADRYFSEEASKGIDTAREIKRQILKTKDKLLRNYETKFISKSDEIIPISLSASLLYDEHGNEAGTIGIAKDLREIKALLVTGQSLLQTHDIVRCWMTSKV